MMVDARPERRCPHCGGSLQPFALPDNTGWKEPVHWACFDDDCEYFRRGWNWMEERFGVRASYRYRVDPATRKDSPLGVWSSTALRDRILGDAGDGPPGNSDPAPAEAAG
jgi:hypothetical protein